MKIRYSPKTRECFVGYNCYPDIDTRIVAIDVITKVINLICCIFIRYVVFVQNQLYLGNVISTLYRDPFFIWIVMSSDPMQTTVFHWVYRDMLWKYSPVHNETCMISDRFTCYFVIKYDNVVQNKMHFDVRRSECGNCMTFCEYFNWWTPWHSVRFGISCDPCLCVQTFSDLFQQQRLTGVYAWLSNRI